MKRTSKHSLDDVLELLRDENRRHMLYQMQSSEENTFTYDDLIEVLTEETSNDYTENQIHISLIQQQFPKMEKKEVIEHFKELEEIRYKPNDLLENLVEDIRKYEEENLE